jgi:hypothetical protein
MDNAHDDGAVSGTLLIVYNADEGLFAALGDAVHKAVSPATYPCSLCAVSYGAVRMRPEWRAHLQALPYGTRFYHRPDFRRAYPALAALPLPAILLDAEAGPRVLLDASTLNALPDVEALIRALDGSLGQVGF